MRRFSAVVLSLVSVEPGPGLVLMRRFFAAVIPLVGGRAPAEGTLCRCIGAAVGGAAVFVVDDFVRSELSHTNPSAREMRVDQNLKFGDEKEKRTALCWSGFAGLRTCCG